MPKVVWTIENDRRLLIRLIERSAKAYDTVELAKIFEGATPKAIEERIAKLKREAKIPVLAPYPSIPPVSTANKAVSANIFLGSSISRLSFTDASDFLEGEAASDEDEKAKVGLTPTGRKKQKTAAGPKVKKPRGPRKKLAPGEKKPRKNGKAGMGLGKGKGKGKRHWDELEDEAMESDDSDVYREEGDYDKKDINLLGAGDEDVAAVREELRMMEMLRMGLKNEVGEDVPVDPILSFLEKGLGLEEIEAATAAVTAAATAAVVAQEEKEMSGEIVDKEKEKGGGDGETEYAGADEGDEKFKMPDVPTAEKGAETIIEGGFNTVAGSVGKEHKKDAGNMKDGPQQQFQQELKGIEANITGIMGKGVQDSQMQISVGA